MSVVDKENIAADINKESTTPQKTVDSVLKENDKNVDDTKDHRYLHDL